MSDEYLDGIMNRQATTRRDDDVEVAARLTREAYKAGYAAGIEAAALACRTEADKLKKAGLMIRHDTALDCVVAVRALVPDRRGKG